MINKQQSKVRFVRCPKCTKVLPEPEHVPVYSCGGCDVTLKAKNYRGPHNNTALSSHEQGVLKRNGIIDAFVDGESSGSSRRSSSDHSSAREEGSKSDDVEHTRMPEQNGAACFFDNSSLSKQFGFLENKVNGEIDDIKSNINCSESKLNGAVLSENSLLSESSCLKQQENREIDNKSGGSCSTSDHNGFSNYSGFKENKDNGNINGENDKYDSDDRGANDHPTILENDSEKLYKVNSANRDDNGQDEECNVIVIETLHEKQIKDVNSDRKTLAQDEPIEEEEEEYDDDDDDDDGDDGDDDDEEKLVRPVKSTQNTSTLTQSAANENPAEHDTYVQELPEKTWKMNIEGKHTQDDRPEQNQIVNMISGKDSRTESPSIEKTTQFASEHSAEKYASYNQQSKGIDLLHPAGKHSCQNVSSYEIDPHELKPEVAKSGNKYGNGTYPNPIEDASSLSEFPELMCHVAVHVQQDVSENGINHFDANGIEVERLSKTNDIRAYQKAIAEQLETVQISSAPSLLTQGENDQSVSIFTSTSVSDNFHEMGLDKISKDCLHLSENSFDKAKGTSKQNIEKVVESVVYIDEKVGIGLKDHISEPVLKRSPASYGSASSSDGSEVKTAAEQPPEVGEESLLLNNVAAGSDGAEKSPECNTLPSERMIFGNLRAARQARRSSSMPLDEKLKSRMVEGRDLQQGDGIHRIYDRNRRYREVLLPKGPFRRIRSEITHQTGTSSSYALHDEASRHRMHPRHPYGRRFLEAPSWRDKDFLPAYYSGTSGEFYDRPKNNSYMNRRQRNEHWSQNRTLPRNAYSAEMLNGRQPYMHHYPEYRRWSAQLPPPAFYFHRGAHMNPGWETKWDPYDSYPTGSQRFMEPKSSYGWGHDAISVYNDPKHKDEIMRIMYLREKREAVKIPFHPIAGGAPFITCYFCFHILQLPQKFLISTRRLQPRRTHEVKCGACCRVLEFFLENEGGLTPCETKKLNRNANMSMSSHSNVNNFRQNSISSADSRVLLSRDSFGASNREKGKIEPGSLSKGERMDAPPFGGRSPKATWHFPARSKSPPLHKLMGYSSPSEMLAFQQADDVQ